MPALRVVRPALRQKQVRRSRRVYVLPGIHITSAPLAYLRMYARNVCQELTPLRVFHASIATTKITNSATLTVHQLVQTVPQIHIRYLPVNTFSVTVTMTVIAMWDMGTAQSRHQRLHVLRVLPGNTGDSCTIKEHPKLGSLSQIAETVRYSHTQRPPGPRPAAAVWPVTTGNIQLRLVRALHQVA